MKLSPLSVPYRVVQRGSSLLFAVAFAAFSGARMLPPGLRGGLGAIAGALLVASLLALLVGYEVAYYRRYEYDLGDDTLDIRSGVVSRRNREIPLGRIQNVDITRNVVQRALGIAAVSFETAGGGETEATLRFVEFTEAKRLQDVVGRYARGDSDGPADEADVEELFAISSEELALLGAFSFDARVPGLLVVVLSGSVPFVSGLVPGGGLSSATALGVATLVVGVVVVSWLAGAAVSMANYAGFRLVQAGDDLQYERGFLRRYDGSIPLEKVQTLAVEDNPAMRQFGYARLRIETAGYSAGGSGGTEAATAVPIARRERVLALAEAVEPFGEPSFERPPRRVRRRYLVRYALALAALSGLLFAFGRAVPAVGPFPASLPVPWYTPFAGVVLAPVAAHLKWTHRGWWLGDGHVVTRNGWWRRRVTVVPYYRVQTVIDTRTVFQRRWGLATVTIDTAGSLSLGGTDASAVDVDAETADRLRDDLDERLREAVAERRRSPRRRPRGPDASGFEWQGQWRGAE
jgi:putative membrane protein